MQTIAHYRNGHLPKISDKAMCYIRYGFIELPVAILRTALWCKRQGYGFRLPACGLSACRVGASNASLEVAVMRSSMKNAALAAAFVPLAVCRVAIACLLRGDWRMAFALLALLPELENEVLDYLIGDMET